MCTRVYQWTYMYLYSAHTHTQMRASVHHDVLKIHTPINGKTPNIYGWSHDSTRFSSGRLTRSLFPSFFFFFSMSPGVIRGNRVLGDIRWYLHASPVDRTFRVQRDYL